MDTLQLLTRSLRAHCAFSALALVVPHLLPSGSFAILLMAETPHPHPHPHPNIIDASENADSLVFVVTLKGDRYNKLSTFYFSFRFSFN